MDWQRNSVAVKRSRSGFSGLSQMMLRLTVVGVYKDPRSHSSLANIEYQICCFVLYQVLCFFFLHPISQQRKKGRKEGLNNIGAFITTRGAAAFVIFINRKKLLLLLLLLLRGNHNDRQQGCLAAATWLSCCFGRYFGVYLRNRFSVCSPRADFFFILYSKFRNQLCSQRGALGGLNESYSVSVLL